MADSQLQAKIDEWLSWDKVYSFFNHFVITLYGFFNYFTPKESNNTTRN
jgi:hypothetical protein